MADVQALHVGAHAEVARQQDVQAGRDVAGAGDDGEQPDVGGVEPGVGERTGHGLLAERHRLGEEALHPRRGAEPGDVLLRRVDDAPAGADGRRLPHLAGDAGVGVVVAEEAVPQRLLVHGRGQGGARTGDRGGHAAPSHVLRPKAWNSPAVDRVGSMRTSRLLPASQAR